jgi:hypothetical protein
LDATRSIVAKRKGIRESEFFQVRIPAFNLVFIGHTENNKLMLTSVTDAETFEIKGNVTRPAEELFLGLKPIAAQDKDLPR